MKSLIFENVSFRYPSGKKIFDDISFSIEHPLENSGHIVGLMGASGAGKSTLLKLILRILKPQSGYIYSTPETPVTSYVPQEAVLFDHLSPLENAKYFSRIGTYKKLFDSELFEKLTHLLGMEETLRVSKSINDLSGGQKQRLMLLRALSVKPDLLLLDEPTNGLDSEVKLQFLLQLKEIVIDQKILALYVSHHKIETELIVDEICYLSQNENGYGEIYQRDLRDFLERPPILEAVKVFNYPKPNILKYAVKSDGLLEVTATDDDHFFYLSVPPQSVHFSNDFGIPFKIVSRNAVYTVIEISGGQRLTIDSIFFPAESYSNVYFSGKSLQYGQDQHLLKEVVIEKNFLI